MFEEITANEPIIIQNDEERIFVDELIEKPYLLRKKLFRLKPVTIKIDYFNTNSSLIKLGREDLVTLIKVKIT